MKESNTSASSTGVSTPWKLLGAGCALVLLELSPGPIISIEYEHKMVLYWL